MANTHKLVQKVSLAANQSSVTFSSIPSGYGDLVIRMIARSAQSIGQTSFAMTFNGSSSGYSFTTLSSNSNDSGLGARSSSQSSISVPNSIGGTQSSGRTPIEIRIPQYAGNTFKSATMACRAQSIGTSNPWFTVNATALWQDTAAITSITLTPSGGNDFLAPSDFYLYATEPISIAAKATGGTVTTDNTYIYHTFIASGTFTPSTNVTAEVLVVAGGGGGGEGGGGGGGAGGLSYHSGKSMTTSTAYTVTVGAGANANSGPGSNSVFDTITSNGGGKGASGGANFGSGGSGGGNWYNSTSPGGSSTQGNTGGATGYGSAGAAGTGGPPYSGGAGGGAGGGSSGRTYWNGTGASTTYAAGGAGSTGSTAGTAGGANTGNGGGAGSSAAAGGSGIVIVRYPI